MASASTPSDAARDTKPATGGPRYAFPEALTAEDLEAMDGVLPDDVTAAHLRWLETGEGDPWGASSG
jgi:hypothetical protein